MTGSPQPRTAGDLASPPRPTRRPVRRGPRGQSPADPGILAPDARALGSILTAIVTPFDGHLAVNEDVFVSLMHHLADHGSDGFVVCGTTGEAPTLTDEEHLRLIELAVSERPEGKTIVAGTGSNDTRHAVYLTERATELGADAVLSVTPYYNRPNRRGIAPPLRGGGGGDRQAGRPLQHPAADGDRHAQRPARRAGPDRRGSTSSSRPTTRTWRRSTAWASTRATTRSSPGRSTSAARAGSSWPATSWATRCAGWSTSRRTGRRSTPRCGTSTRRCR